MRKTLIITLNALFLCLVVFITVAHSVQTDTGGIAERRAQLAEAIDGFPESAQELLRSVVLSDDFVGVFSMEQAHDLSALMGLSANETALALISLARVYAAAPISNFHVGAVAVGRSGAMYFGCNMEFPGQALSFSVHAEQAATINAWMHEETGLRAIAITAPPCGYCRQFLNELSTADDLEILLRNAPPMPLRTLLPEAFGPTDLDMELRLMDEALQPLRLATPTDDKVVLAALAAASTSYAPYSGNHAGVAIESATGVIVSGRYAENAAYNPSMSPLAAALVLSNFANQDLGRIKRAVLVQTNPDSASQKDASKAVLSVLAGNLELEEYAAVGE